MNGIWSFCIVLVWENYQGYNTYFLLKSFYIIFSHILLLFSHTIYLATEEKRETTDRRSKKKEDIVMAKWKERECKFQGSKKNWVGNEEETASPCRREEDPMGWKEIGKNMESKLTSLQDKVGRCCSESVHANTINITEIDLIRGKCCYERTLKGLRIKSKGF